MTLLRGSTSCRRARPRNRGPRRTGAPGARVGGELDRGATVAAGRRRPISSRPARAAQVRRTRTDSDEHISRRRRSGAAPRSAGRWPRPRRRARRPAVLVGVAEISANAAAPTRAPRTRRSRGSRPRAAGDDGLEVVAGPPDQQRRSRRHLRDRRRPGGTAARVPCRRGRVGRAQPALVLVLELRPQPVGQRLERRPGAGAADPGEHRVLAGEHVQVRRLPGVDGAAEAGQRVEVGLRPEGVRRRAPRRCTRRTARRRPARGAGRGWARRSCRAPGTRTSRRARPAPTRRGSRSRWPGTHCRVALETSTSTGSPARQVRRSATAKATRAAAARAPRRPSPARSPRRARRRRASAPSAAR